MLVTATEARRKADEALKTKERKEIEEIAANKPVKGNLNDESEEIKFISEMIEYNYNQGKIECDFDFEFSDKATEILESFLYYVGRERKNVGW